MEQFPQQFQEQCLLPNTEGDIDNKLKTTSVCAAVKLARRERKRAKVKEMFAVDLDIEDWDL